MYKLRIKPADDFVTDRHGVAGSQVILRIPLWAALWYYDRDPRDICFHDPRLGWFRLCNPLADWENLLMILDMHSSSEYMSQGYTRKDLAEKRGAIFSSYLETPTAYLRIFDFEWKLGFEHKTSPYFRREKEVMSSAPTKIEWFVHATESPITPGDAWAYGFDSSSLRIPLTSIRDTLASVIVPFTYNPKRIYRWSIATARMLDPEGLEKDGAKVAHGMLYDLAAAKVFTDLTKIRREQKATCLENAFLYESLCSVVDVSRIPQDWYPPGSLSSIEDY